MLVSIDAKFFEQYPDVEIGYLIATVSIKKECSYVETLNRGLVENLLQVGVNATNFAGHPKIAIWRKIYQEDFHVKPKSYRSSVEALLKRVLAGKKLWNINNVVDLYNYCSIHSLAPMGGYDLDKVSGDIAVRFGLEGETFLGLGETKSVEVGGNQVVYADDSRVICWLWNHKDSAETSIDETTKTVIFFIDAIAPQPGEVARALEHLSGHLGNIQCQAIESGILSQGSPKASIGALR